MPAYYALTTTQPKKWGWKIIAVANSVTEAETAAEKILGTLADAVINHDIYRETEIKNLTIKSMSAAIRGGFVPRGFDFREHPAWQIDNI